MKRTLRCCSALNPLWSSKRGLGDAAWFFLLPKSFPNTDFKDDLLRCGFPSLAGKGMLAVEACEFSERSWRGAGGDARVGRGGFEIWFSVASSSKCAEIPRLCRALLSGRERRDDALKGNGLSMPSFPNGVAIDAPGDLIGNSSSSVNGMGALIFPRMEDPVFVLLGASALHFAGPRSLLIVLWGPGLTGTLIPTRLHKQD